MGLSTSNLVRTVQNVRSVDPSACIVFSNGCFANLHRGHIHMLSAYTQHPNAWLFVALNDDAYLKKKHPQATLQDADLRRRIVDCIVKPAASCIFSEGELDPLLAAIKPDVYLQGSDHQENGQHPHAKLTVYIPRLSEFATKSSIIN